MMRAPSSGDNKNDAFTRQLHTGYFLYVFFLIISLTPVSYADEFPYTYRSSYFLGRGDTGLAIADNEDAIFYNPAGIALGKGLYKKTVFAAPMLEVSQDTRDVIRKIAVEDEAPTSILREHEGRPQHLGFNTFTGVILRRAALGAFASNSSTLMLFKDPDGGSLESLYVGSTAAAGMTFSLAQDFFNQTLLVGFTGKYIMKGQANFKASAAEAESLSSINPDSLAMKGQGTGADIGVMYKIPSQYNISLGLTIQDIGNTTFTPDQKTDLSKKERPLKDNLQTINAGIAVEPGQRASRFKFMLDLRDLENRTGNSFYRRFHLGSEITVKDIVGITVGINQGYPTFGFYTDIRVLRLDLGFYTEELDELAGRRPDNRYFFRLSAGL
ncbi:MAG: hypothetical protein R3B45_05275 [Bdellovibrionota bacterium]